MVSITTMDWIGVHLLLVPNGVGLAVARHFAEKGANVMFADMDEAKLVEEIGGVSDDENGTTAYFAGDLREKLNVANLLSATIDRFERALIELPGPIFAHCKSGTRAAILWDEVKDRLHTSALRLSGGQQQRLCIARAIAVDPEVILMDEPCSALDPIATARIEDLIDELSANYAIGIVTHSMQQAARVSQRTAYFHLGKLIEVGETSQIFTNPSHRLTENYVTGRFG